MKWICIIAFSLNVFVGIGVVVILLLLFAGGYMLYRKQMELLQMGKEQKHHLSSITKQTTLIPNIDKQFRTPQYLAQFTVTLSNARKNVLRLGDIIYVSVEKKTLQVHTQKVTYTMEGKLSDVVGGENPLLPYPLFVRVQKSYVVNVLYIIESTTRDIYLDILNEKKLPKRISLSDSYKDDYIKAFLRRENKML